MNKACITLILSFIAASSMADVRLPRLFGDNMILQQKTKNAVWGWADAGEKVTVKSSWGAEASATADADGKWKLFLETPAYGTGNALTVSGNNTIKIKNVAIGEVWLCAGQSNMGWSFGQTFAGEAEPDVDLPDFRIFKSQREHWHEPLDESRDRLKEWKPCTNESATETSAVSFWFGRKLHEELGIPVGIIVQAYAGTPVESWMPWEIQKEDPRAIFHKGELDASYERQTKTQGFTEKKMLEKFEQELVVYNEKIDAGETMKNSVKKLAPPTIVKPANLGNQYPENIFNAMIYPIRPYGIRGMIWYQGERNSKDVQQAIEYRRQLAMMIRYYRDSWHELSGGNVANDFPFQMTQLPSWNPPQTEPVEGVEASWAVNREMMRLITSDVPNTGMAVAIDTGDPVVLHPRNKKPVGLRHAYVALKQTYGKDIVGSGPCYQKQTIDGDQIVLEFSSAGGGLTAAKDAPLDSFAVAGKDQEWHWATAKIIGSTVVVSSEEVSDPLAVRYAWAMNPSQRNLLYNQEGIPASPFRTDAWDLFDPDDEVVRVNKPKKDRSYVSRDWKRPEMTQ